MTAAKTPSTPNPLKQRDPSLAKSLAAFQLRFGNMLLDTLAPLLDDPAFRSHQGEDLGDLRAVAQILRVFAKDKWTEQDLETFDTHWRDASRADLFADEYEADRHRIQILVETARSKLSAQEPATEQPRMKQPTLFR